MKNLPTPKQCESVSNLLKILSHPHRLMILCLLSDGEKTVSELEQSSGATQSSVSQFLARMKAEKIVTSTRDANNVIYQIADPRISKLLQNMYNIFCS